MALESGTYIDSLNAANPVATDGLAQADDHLRLIKSTIKATFPSITGAISLSHTQINTLDTRLTAIENGVHASGTKLMFQQSAAPTGWTKDTSHNDKTLRVVSGTAGTGGTNAFSSAFSYTPAGSVNTSVSGTVANHTLSTAQIPAHGHSITGTYTVDNGSGGGGSFPHGSARSTPGRPIDNFLSITASNTGGGQAHNHGWSGSASSAFIGTAVNFAPQYVDVIICTKD